MQKLFLSFILFIVCISGFSQTNYPSGVSGCIARWTFDAAEGGVLDSIYDVSGNLNHGTNHNIVSTNGWRNIAGKAGDFNGSSSWSEVMSNAQLNPTNITTIALIKFYSFYNSNCQGNNIIYKGFNYNANLSWAMYVADNDQNCGQFNPTMEKLFFQLPNLGTTIVPSSNYIQTNKWYFLATSFNGSTIKYYQIEMDTLLKATNIIASYTSNSSVPLGNSTDNVYIGVTQNPAYKYWFNGQMDEVIVFNKALADSEIESVYSYLYGVATGVKNMNVEDNINVTCTNKNIKVTDNSNENKQIEIMDMSGRVLQRLPFLRKVELDLSFLPNQFLLIKIIDKQNKVITKKIALY